MKMKKALLFTMLISGMMLASCGGAGGDGGSGISKWAKADTITLDEKMSCSYTSEATIKSGESHYVKLDASKLEGGHVYRLQEFHDAYYDYVCYDKNMNVLNIDFFSFKPDTKAYGNTRLLSEDGKWFTTSNWYIQYESNITRNGHKQGHFFTFDSLEDNTIYLEIVGKMEHHPHLRTNLSTVWAHKYWKYDYCVNKDAYCGKSESFDSWSDISFKNEKKYITRYNFNGAGASDYAIRFFQIQDEMGENTVFNEDGSLKFDIELLDNDFNPIQYNENQVEKTHNVESNISFSVPAEYLNDANKFVHLCLTLKDSVTDYSVNAGHYDRVLLRAL